MLVQGVCFLILQAGVVAIYESDKLIILKVLGADEVTRYAVPGRLFVLMYGLFMLMIAPLWPAHGEALRRGDFAWMRRALRNQPAHRLRCDPRVRRGDVLRRPIDRPALDRRRSSRPCRGLWSSP